MGKEGAYALATMLPFFIDGHLFERFSCHCFLSLLKNLAAIVQLLSISHYLGIFAWHGQNK